jgi:hypothetical protein
MKIIRSPRSSKKFRALFDDGTHTDFGAVGYEDFTQHKDAKRREMYRQRHKNDNLQDYKSAGALSWYILWGSSTSLQTNLAAYKKRFNLS